jgi:hypothetical protein
MSKPPARKARGKNFHGFFLLRSQVFASPVTC